MGATIIPRLGMVAQAALVTLLLLGSIRSSSAAQVNERGTLAMEEVPEAQFHLEGFVGNRVAANVEHWLNVAPKNNPGLTDMFARRDSGQPIDLVPWAGEFAGKFLISGVQALRMSDDVPLRQTLERLVEQLVALQAEDGYLGPWPNDQRLRGHWDLWGHYHVMLGMLMWYEQTGDARGLAVARRMGDLVCNTFLDTKLRVFDAGSHEMNMAIIHGLTQLYRATGEPRYLEMAQEVLADFERAGDYYRTGLAGVEFFRTPKPRWESLHCLQGLVELYRITGDASYRQAFLNHWRSIRSFDLRNTGGFSSGERATGEPFTNSPIETCCVIAWQAVMLDALRLTGDSTIADDLELATFNAALGAQHPSGAWCTYDTPMSGVRGPSHIQIQFQAREDTPHLNCCSVNGPRGYGMISQWGLMQDRQGPVINYYGPMTVRFRTADGHPVTIRQETDYPIHGSIRMYVQPERSADFTLAVRIPSWSRDTRVAINGQAVSDVAPGSYCRLARTWQPDDIVEVNLDLTVRHEPGDQEQFGKASFYRGPILLTRDDRLGELPISAKVAIERLGESSLAAANSPLGGPREAASVWLMVDLPTCDGGAIRTLDFASAGAATISGEALSHYETWLPASPLAPPRPVGWLPTNGARIGPGPIRFAWRRPATAAMATRRHRIAIFGSPDAEQPLVQSSWSSGRWLDVTDSEAARLQHGKPYYWEITARNDHGQTASAPPRRLFKIDPSLPRSTSGGLYGERIADGMLTEDRLAGRPAPDYGSLQDASGWAAASGPGGQAGGAIRLDGESGIVRYKITQFPDEDFTVSIWLLVDRMPRTQYGQVFSAWAAGVDDPLRLFVSNARLGARIEAGSFFDTDSIPLQAGKWYHAACVKRQDKLTLFVDGRAVDTMVVPTRIGTAARNFAIGGNPNYAGGPEFLAGCLAQLKFYARALTDREIRELAGED